MLQANLSYFKNLVQRGLFPYLREELPEFDEDHEKISMILSISQPENFIHYDFGKTGRPVKDRAKIARAFVAKAALNIPTTKDLLKRLRYDHSLRIICGWSYHYSLPSESTFSRAFAEFAQCELPERIHKALIKLAYQDKVLQHISRDATDIPVREKSKRSKSKAAEKRNSEGGPPAKPGKSKTHLQMASGKNWKELLAELRHECDSGSKVSSKRTRMYWMGYKLSVDVSDDGIPVSCILTAASVSDMLLAIPLSRKSEQRTTPFYELMDQGYYSKAIREFIEQRGRIPVIQKKPINKKMKEEMAIEARNRKALGITSVPEYRLKHRTVVERFFSDLKDNFTGRFVRVKTCAKVFCHLMFGIVALTVCRKFKALC